jgi:tetratricopeptide (TPR) repeat protein
MPESVAFQLVDLHDSGNELRLQWRRAPGSHARPVDAATVERIGQQVTALTEAAHYAGLERNVVSSSLHAPARPGLAAAQRALGETLYELLDGPDRALTRRLDDARRDGSTLHLVVRLRAPDLKALARHRALSWHLPMIAAPDGPLALAPDVTIAVQIGDAEIAARDTVPGGRLQVLFMASSPRDVQPVLDYEDEEERFLRELAPFVEERRLVLKVAEDGSLDELRRRLMRRSYDIIHLTGHGTVTDQGPRLVMEDANGDREDVSAEQLLKTLRAGRAMPRLLVLSSCHSADHRTDLPSLAAELIQDGVPCVVGWTRPVRDDVATDAAEVLYHRLCCGDLPTEAVARARRELHRDDQARPVPTHAWSTLELLATKLPGFAIDPNETPVRDPAPAPGALYRMLGSRMRVLDKGFVGRRRELQALGRVLRHGRWTPPGETERAVSGALVVGMKGQGKSCLVGRALERHQQDSGPLSLVVLHGTLDELQILDAFRTEAVRLGDEAAERLLDDSSRTAPRRIERLLRHHWRERPLVIVLDDFEQNLDVPGEGEARLAPLAAALLEVLLPACRDEQPKLLVTSTARFALPAPLAGLLAELPLGALDGASVRKLWLRGRSAELSGMGPAAWSQLSERLGRNARILGWARQLLAGKTPDEVRAVLAEAGTTLPVWQDQPIDEAKADELAAAFLRHMAFHDAAKKVGPDAMAFVERARVYEVPVPVEAFAGLTAGLAISLDRHVPALANLGLLEMGSEDGRSVYRVSPMVKPTFEAAEGERWHGAAAEYWWQAAAQGKIWSAPEVLQAWEHALAAKRQHVADAAADLLQSWLDRRGAYAHSAALGARHIAAFPDSVAGLNWAGYARFRAGDPRGGRRLLERAVELASSNPDIDGTGGRVAESLARVLASLGEYSAAARYFTEFIAAEEALYPDGSVRLGEHLHALGGVLLARGDLTGARTHLERSLAIEQKVLGTEDHPDVAASLHALAGVLLAQGELASARTRLERAIAIEQKVHGTEDHPDVAASLHELARVLLAQGDLTGARAHLERSLAIKRMVYGTQDHPEIATSLHELARVLLAQGDLVGARARLERALAIEHGVHGTEEHPAVAASLHELAGVLRAQGDLTGARAYLERSLDIKQMVHGTEDHPDVAASLHELARVLLAQGDLAGARARLERSLTIDQKVHGTEDHPAVATSLHTLAGVLLAQGDLAAARAHLERSLAIDQKVHGTEDHPNIALSLQVLGGVLFAQGDMVGARARFERSLEIAQKVHGTEDHPDVAGSLYALAGVLRAQGDLSGARARLERSLDIRQTFVGTKDHCDVAASLHALAGVLRDQGDLAGARTRLERSLAIERKVHSTDDHPDVAASLHALAGVLHAQGDLAGARAFLQRSLEIERKVHSTDDHPDVAASLHALAGVLHAQGDLTGARAFLERSLEIKRKVHGPDGHPDIAASLHALAGVLRAQGDLAGARTQFERSLEINRKVHDTEDHLDVATTYDGLGNCLRDLELLDESERAFFTALRIREKVLGSRDHYMYAETEFTLALLAAERGRDDEARELLQHAVAILQAQVPNHPILAALRDSDS